MRLQSYLLAETLRHVEEDAGTPRLAPDAEKQAIAAGPAFPDRILARAAILASASAITVAVQRAGGRILFVVLGFTALCFIIGIGATHALPEGFPARANIVSLLALLLLPNLVSLLFWLVLSIRSLISQGPIAASGWLGRQTLAVYALLERLFHANASARAAGRAWRDYLTQTAGGRRRLIIISHCCWIAALIGALTGCWWLLVVRQVDFVWGSTLLTVADVQSLLGNITRWVAAFGFNVPSPDDIAASRIDTQPYAADLRRHWGVFILNAIFTLALLPRLIALVLDLIGYWRAVKNLQLDLTHPGYVRLLPLLMPLHHAHASLDTADGPARVTDRPSGISTLSSNLPADAAWLALEHPPAQLFPRKDIKIDLGVLATHGDLQTVMERLATRAPGWQAVCILADLAITPDQGIARQLQKLISASTRPVHLVLVTSSRAAAIPAADLQTRREDWLRLAVHAGLTAERLHQYVA